VRDINLMRDYGQHNALLWGIRVAKAEAIFYLERVLDISRCMKE